MDLSIIIVNWRSGEFSRDCIAAIRRTAGNLTYEIIVVDNASDDDSCRMIEQLEPPVDLIRSPRNLGFSRANNVGLARARGRNVLFLNPDTIVSAGALEAMMRHLDTSEATGAVGPRLLNGDLTLQTSCVQAFPRILNQIFGLDWLKGRWPSLGLWKMQALYSSGAGVVTEVEAVSGACLMARKSVLGQVGGFSTEYFLYAEEIDLCLRIRNGGWKVCHVSDSTVIHFGGQSTKQRGCGFSDVLMRQSIYLFLRKFRGAPYAAVYRAALLCSAIVRVALLCPMAILPRQLGLRAATSGALRKWFYIARWGLSLYPVTVAKEQGG